MATPVTPDSLISSPTTGWHAGDKTVTYAFITQVPDYYIKTNTDGDGKDDSYLISPGQSPNEPDFTVPFGASVAMGKAEVALTRLAIREWAEVAKLNLVEVKPGPDVKTADITLGSYRFEDELTFGFVLGEPKKDDSENGAGPGVPSSTGDFWINTGNPNQVGAVYGNTGWQTYLHEFGHALGLDHPNGDGGDPKNPPIPFHNNQYTVMSYIPHPGMKGIEEADQSWPITPMMYDIAAIQKLYGANFETRAGATSYFGTNGAYALKDGGLLANGRTAILTVWDAGGVDTIDASNQTGSVRIDLNPGTFSTIGKVANNIGLALAVTNDDGVIVNLIENAKGGSAADTLVGNVGNNVLNGGAGADTLTGGAGNDTYVVDHAGDRVFEAKGGGADRVVTSVSYALAAGQEVETLATTVVTGTAGLNLTGNEFANTITGNAGANVLNGGAGADLLQGLAGNDIYVIDNVGDRIVEAKGAGADRAVTSVSYTLAAGQEIETLATTVATGTAALNLTGNEFANTITGNAGANVLHGGLGADVLTGGRGADTFVFATALSVGNIDRITDFAVEDTVRLSKSVFAALAPGQLTAGEFKDLGKARVDADDHVLYDSRDGSLFYDADGSGSAAAVKFAVLDNKAAITHADFLIA